MYLDAGSILALPTLWDTWPRSSLRQSKFQISRFGFKHWSSEMMMSQKSRLEKLEQASHATMIEQFNRECGDHTDDELLSFAANGYWPEVEEEPCREH